MDIHKLKQEKILDTAKEEKKALEDSTMTILTSFQEQESDGYALREKLHIYKQLLKRRKITEARSPP